MRRRDRAAAFARPAALLVALALLLALGPDCGGVPAGRPRLEEIWSLAEFESHFDSTPGTARLVLLLSPT